MTDYTKPTGATGTMLIRDTGTTVEFYLRAGSGTYNYQLPWAYEVNGVSSGWQSFRFEQGGAWQFLRSWTVTTTQTVLFRLGVSGTAGLGGETWFYQTINRSTTPGAPTPVVLSSITSTSMFATFTDGTNGGVPILNRYIGYGTDGNTPQIEVPSDLTTSITSLLPGTVYYFWAKTHNIHGYGPWSVRSSATTLRVPNPPTPPLLAALSQKSVGVTFSVATDNGGAPILEYNIGYGLVPTGPSSTVVGNPGTQNTIAALNPGTLYYFWVRARNSVGWSAWSNSRNIRTISGARVKVGAVWKEAVPYVKDGGVWKLAQPWSRIMGVWKKTT